MQVRLGFAVATLLLKPDVLILDEVLAVGDNQFRAKCYRTINEMMRSAAVILVSHTMPHVSQFCSHSMVLDKGRSVFPAGNPHSAIEHYDALLNPEAETPEGYFCDIGAPVISATTRLSANRVQNDDEVDLEITIECTEPITRCFPRVTLISADDRAIIEWNSLRTENSIAVPAGTTKIDCRLGALPLRAGVYFLWVALIGSGNGPGYFNARKCERIVVVGSATGASECQFPLQFTVASQ